MGKWSVVEYRNIKDFHYGSFTVYLRANEIIIRGILKKSNASGKYMLIRRG